MLFSKTFRVNSGQKCKKAVLYTPLKNAFFSYRGIGPCASKMTFSRELALKSATV